MSIAVLISFIVTLQTAWSDSKSCLSPDIQLRIRIKVNAPSPFAGCQHAFKVATKTCADLIRWNILDARPLQVVKAQQEKQIAACARRVAAAKRSCADDQAVLGVLRTEFNDVLNCADHSLATINGRIMKDAEWARVPASVDDEEDHAALPN